MKWQPWSLQHYLWSLGFKQLPRRDLKRLCAQLNSRPAALAMMRQPDYRTRD